jgi:ABC-2 type transport system ATP-binding protein
VLTTHYLEEAEALCGRIAMLKQGRIVALDTTSNLVRTVNPGLHVDVRLDAQALPEALAPLAVQQLATGAWRLSLKEYGELEGVLAALRLAGVRLHEMEIVRPDLEEVFVRIMSGH